MFVPWGDFFPKTGTEKKSFRKTTCFFLWPKKCSQKNPWIFFSGHFCCSSGNCNTFGFNEPGFLPSECILRCSNLATEQWFPRGWNGKGPPRIRVPRYMFIPSFGALIQDAFNPFYASRFSTFAHAFVPFQTSHGYPVRWVFSGALDEAWILNVPMRPPMPRDIATWPVAQHTGSAHS